MDWSALQLADQALGAASCLNLAGEHDAEEELEKRLKKCPLFQRRCGGCLIIVCYWC